MVIEIYLWDHHNNNNDHHNKNHNLNRTRYVMGGSVIFGQNDVKAKGHKQTKYGQNDQSTCTDACPLNAV